MYLRIGDPPPMLSYAALLLGARRLAINEAMIFWSGARGPGNRMMSGSANKLKRNSSTSSPVVGPPKFKKRTPSPPSLLSSIVGVAKDGADDSDIPVAALNTVVLLSFLLYVAYCSEDPGEVAQSLVEVVISSSQTLLLPMKEFTSDRRKVCGLPSNVNAVALLLSTTSDDNATRTHSLNCILIVMDSYV